MIWRQLINELADEDSPEQIGYLEKDITGLLLKIQESPEILNDFEMLNN